MDANEHQRHSYRAAFLTILLGGLLLAGIVIAAIAFVGPFAIFASLLLAFLTITGIFHYLVWGRSFSREVANERVEEEVPPEEDEDWPPRASRSFNQY